MLKFEVDGMFERWLIDREYRGKKGFGGGVRWEDPGAWEVQL